MKTAEDGKRVLVRPRVVDAGYANRKLLRLTGLDVQENQARRLLNDLDAYRASTWREGEIWKSWPPTGCVRCSSRPCV